MATCEAVTQLVVDAGDHLGETPVWSAAEQALYWVNCEEPPQLRRWDAATGEVKTWPMPERIGGMALRRDGDPILCLGSGVYNFNLASAELSLLAKSPWPPHVKLHESCVDRAGRLWVGAFDESFGEGDGQPGGGGLCRLEGDTLITMLPHISIANSLAFGPDGRVMYFADTMRRLVWRAEIDPKTGAILGMREFAAVGKHEVADGAVVDEEGGYWLAVFGSGEIRRYLPDGTLDSIWQMPCSQPTKAAFGGPDLKTLYVTSARVGIGYEQRGRNGAVFAFESDVRGLPEEFFAG